jgi:DNA invertase Pin-like site-specific DNA recombinase
LRRRKSPFFLSIDRSLGFQYNPSPHFRTLISGKTAYVVGACWYRLGRNYENLCDNIREFMRRGVVIRTVINNFTFYGATEDPMQQMVRDALIGFIGKR